MTQRPCKMTIIFRFRLFALALLYGLGGHGCAGVGTPPKKPPSPHKSFFSVAMHLPIPKFAKKQSPPIATPVSWSGTIRMVNEPENFVLIEQAANTPEQPGGIYIAVGNGHEKGKLKMTSMKSFPYLIADIVAGDPEVGDKIYFPSPLFPPRHPQNQ